jgi:hypothetical protein
MTKLIIFEEYDNEENIIEDFDLATIQQALIGSGPDNDLVLEADGVDPAHASLELRQDDWVLQDLGGPGGTFVNEQIVDGPYHLQHNDLIEMGVVKLRYKESAANNSVSPAKPAEMTGRVWFAGIAGFTLAFIFVIVFLLAFAHYLEVINMTDLLPPWLLP